MEGCKTIDETQIRELIEERVQAVHCGTKKGG